MTLADLPDFTFFCFTTVNVQTEHVQSCIDPNGVDHGPASVDVGPTGLDALGFQDGPLHALEYEILW